MDSSWTCEGKIRVWHRGLVCLLEDRHRDLKDGYLRMHDVIHDLALHIGGEEYCSDRVGKNTHHLSMIDKDKPSFPQDKGSSSKLRTLLCPRVLPSSLPVKFVGNLQRLRVLELGILWGEFPHWIDKLLHLRYLELSQTHVQSLDMLHKLPFLRTLKLYQCRDIEWLPCLSKVKVMKLKWLNCLNGLTSREDDKAVILLCLMTLEIESCNSIKCLPCLSKVEVMKLKWLKGLKGWSEEGKTVILPSLRTLEIKWCEEIKWLPYLTKVEVMKLELLKNLEGWPSREYGKAVILPCLRTLEMIDCQKVKMLPDLPAIVELTFLDHSSLTNYSCLWTIPPTFRI